jgi:hypothetical protein
MKNTSPQHICGYNIRVRVSHITAGRQPASLSWCRASTEAHDQIHHVSVRRPRVLIFCPHPHPQREGGSGHCRQSQRLRLCLLFTCIYA